jgi:hypothetical protein
MGLEQVSWDAALYYLGALALLWRQPGFATAHLPVSRQLLARYQMLALLELGDAAPQPPPGAPGWVAARVPLWPDGPRRTHIQAAWAELMRLLGQACPSAVDELASDVLRLPDLSQAERLALLGVLHDATGHTMRVAPAL